MSDFLYGDPQLSYSTSDNTTLSQSVHGFTSNGTNKMTEWGTASWSSIGGIYSDGSAGSYVLTSGLSGKAAGILTAWTLSAWVNLNSTSVGGVARDYYNHAGDIGLEFGGVLYYDVKTVDAGWQGGGGAYTLTTGNWLYLTFEYDGSRFMTFANGVIQDNSSSAGHNVAATSFMYFDRCKTTNSVNGTVQGVSFFDRAINVTELGYVVSQGHSGHSFLNYTGLMEFWAADEGSGSRVWSYNQPVVLTSTAVGYTIGQTAGAINSSLYLTDTYPLGNSTDRYSTTDGLTSYRVNASAAMVVNFTHQVDLISAVSPAGAGTNNLTTDWYTTLQTIGIQANATLGNYFSNWLIDGTASGNANPSSLYVSASHTYTASFTTTPPTTQSIQSTFDLIAQYFIAGLAFLFMGLTFFYHDTDEQSSPITNGLGIIRFLLFPILSAILFAVFAGMALVSLNYGATFAWTLFTLGFALALVMTVTTIALVLIATGKVFRDAATSKGKVR
jgi:hypothetical protein